MLVTLPQWPACVGVHFFCSPMRRTQDLSIRGSLRPLMLHATQTCHNHNETHINIDKQQSPRYVIDRYMLEILCKDMSCLSAPSMMQFVDDDVFVKDRCKPCEAAWNGNNRFVYSSSTSTQVGIEFCLCSSGCVLAPLSLLLAHQIAHQPHPDLVLLFPVFSSASLSMHHSLILTSSTRTPST